MFLQLLVDLQNFATQSQNQGKIKKRLRHHVKAKHSLKNGPERKHAKKGRAKRAPLLMRPFSYLFFTNLPKFCPDGCTYLHKLYKKQKMVSNDWLAAATTGRY